MSALGSVGASHRDWIHIAEIFEAFDRGAGLRRIVARVIDHGRVGPVLERARQGHVHGELRAVARGQVSVTRLQRLLGIESVFRETVLYGHHPDGTDRILRHHDGITVTRWNVSEDVAAKLVRGGLRDEGVGAVAQLDGRVGLGLPDVDLLDGASHLERLLGNGSSLSAVPTRSTARATSAGAPFAVFGVRVTADAHRCQQTAPDP